MYGETSTCSTQASQHNTNRSNIEYGITTLYNHKTTAQQTTSTEHNTNFIQNLASPTPFILTEQSLNNNTQPADKNSQTERPASQNSSSRFASRRKTSPNTHTSPYHTNVANHTIHLIVQPQPKEEKQFIPSQPHATQDIETNTIHQSALHILSYITHHTTHTYT